MELADPDRIHSNDPALLRELSANAKSLSALSKCLFAFNSKEKIVPCRDNKFTQALKDSFNSSVLVV